MNQLNTAFSMEEQKSTALNRVQKIVGHLAKNYVLSKPVLFFSQKTEINPEEVFEKILHMIEEKDFSNARKEIFNTLPYFQEGEEMIRAYRLVGLTYYRNEEYLESLPWFKKSASSSTEPSDWFNLASAAAQAKHVELAMEAFETLEELHKQSKFEAQPSFWIHLYWFILALINTKEYLISVHLMKRLSNAYEKARFTDKKYLNEIGLPSFEEFLAILFSLKSNVTTKEEIDEIEETLKFLNENIDESGRNMIEFMKNEQTKKIEFLNK
eukprot:gene1703-472_t